MLKHEGFESGHKPFDAGDGDGELLSLRQVVVLLLKLLQSVELVRGWDVLDERLEQVFRQHGRVTPAQMLPFEFGAFYTFGSESS